MTLCSQEMCSGKVGSLCMCSRTLGFTHLALLDYLSHNVDIFGLWFHWHVWVFGCVCTGSSPLPSPMSSGQPNWDPLFPPGGPPRSTNGKHLTPVHSNNTIAINACLSNSLIHTFCTFVGFQTNNIHISVMSFTLEPGWVCTSHN